MPRARSHLLAVCGALFALALLPHAPAEAATMGSPWAAGLQVGLKNRGFYDGTVHGHMTSATRAAVRALQRRERLAVDGIAGPQTREALGPRTDRALRLYQRRRGLPVDGILGPATVRALKRAQPPRPGKRLVRPVRGRASDRFGPRGSRFHAGLDFPARSGAV